ncbi:hypothetical protein AAG906_036788 [Vitis piasezkii]
MDLEGELTHLDLSDADAASSSGVDGGSESRRRICDNCSRPENVCLCGSLPSEPISTATQIVILHHPHEHRHKLSTVPILTKCLLNTHTIVGRRLRHGSSAMLDSLHSSSSTDQLPRAIYLFPGPTSTHISQLNPKPGTVLILFDATWKHAKEMVDASAEYLSTFAIRACLDCDFGETGGSIFDSELILRKEPFRGCVSTMEAAARALRFLEPNGPEIESRLLNVLREMVKFQASHLKPMKPRPKLLKKGQPKKE